MKGVSPIVATVLLIAITVVSATALWYWSGEYVSDPGVDVTRKEITLTQCNGSQVFVRNTGSVALTGVLDIYNASYAKVATLNVTGIGLNGAGMRNLTLLGSPLSGSFKATGAGYLDEQFSCS